MCIELYGVRWGKPFLAQIAKEHGFTSLDLQAWQESRTIIPMVIESAVRGRLFRKRTENQAELCDG